MHLLFVEPIVNSGLVRAFCWTLIHSCWQGLALAVLTGLIVLLTRRSRPVVRYYLFSGLFLLFFLTVCATFLYEVGSDQITVVNISEPSVVQVVHIGTQESAVQGTTASGRMEAIVAFFNRNAPLIVGIWMFLFLAKLVRFGSNLIAVNRIRNHKVNVPAGDWGYRVQGMAAKLGIRRNVRLMESPLIAAPMTAGMLKPVILAPLGLLANLPPDQVEAILLHELAHIQRKDYFINLLQTFLETLFFFNPAVYWLSSLIRDERESCCDDIAIGQSKSKKEFVHALVSFHEYLQPGMAGAMAFPGKGGSQLLNRVRRIVGRDDKRLGSGEKGFLLVCVLAAAGLMMAFTRMDREPVGAVKPIQAKEVVLDAALKENRFVADAMMINGRLLDNDTVPTAKKRDSLKIVSEKMAKLLEEQKMLRDEEARLEEQQQVLAKRRVELDQRAREINMKSSKDDLYFEGVDKVESSETRANAGTGVLMLAHANVDTIRFKAEGDEHALFVTKLDAERDARTLFETKLDAERNEHVLFEAKQDAEKQVLRLNKVKLKNEGKDAMHQVVDPILDEILGKKMATDGEHLRFELDEKGFVVNGVRQPEEVFEAMKVKYLVDHRNQIKYSRNGNETSISVGSVKN